MNLATIKTLCARPHRIVAYAVKHCTRLLRSDRLYLGLLWWGIMGRRLDWEHPRTFNEKLQWLKLHNRQPHHTAMADKVLAKEWVARRIGAEHVIPTLGVWERPEEIDFDALPERFVLKCNHNSGGMVFCRDKSTFDRKGAIRTLRRALREDYSLRKREYPYREIRRRILAEPLLEEGGELRDYKIFCFDGRVRFFKVDFGRFVEHHANYYDTDLRLLPFGEAAMPPVPDADIAIPPTIHEMFRIAECLSRGEPFLRVDLYDYGGHIYFGELTLFPAGGFGEFTPPEYDLTVGGFLRIEPDTATEHSDVPDISSIAGAAEPSASPATAASPETHPQNTSTDE